MLSKRTQQYNEWVEKAKKNSHNHTSSRLNALALGIQEWFIQLCRGKKAVPDAKNRQST